MQISINLLNAAVVQENTEIKANAEAPLGEIFYNGHCVPKDFEKARNLFERAALEIEQDKYGNAQLQLTLSEMYYFGHGMQADYKKALQFFEYVSQEGYNVYAKGLAQIRLGQMYYCGPGIPKNSEKARELWSLTVHKNPYTAINQEAIEKLAQMQD